MAASGPRRARAPDPGATGQRRWARSARAPDRGDLLLACCALALVAGCAKKKPTSDEAALGVTPPQGAASAEELSTGLGQARGLEEALAPTSAVWRRAIVVDERRVLLVGDLPTETISLLTEDGGQTWRALHVERDAWANWSISAEGVPVLAMGARGGAKAVTGSTLDSVRMLFVAADKVSLTDPSPLALPPRLKAAPLDGPSALPVGVSADTAALIGEEAPHRGSVFFGGRPGADVPAPVKLPPGERFIAVPYGRPAQLLSLRGRDLVMRALPSPGKPVEVARKVAGVVASPALAQSLQAPPACEASEWSFQRVRLPKPGVLGISPGKTLAFPLPEAVSRWVAPSAQPTGHPDASLSSPRMGCGGTRLAFEATDPASKKLTLASCDFDGKCVLPQNAPFRVWPAPEEHELALATTAQATLGALAERAGERWGLYLAQSTDGTLFEQPRVVGEGSGDRGRLELGALVSLGKRTMLLLSADVTGTSRRRWYVMVSDDAGSTWGPP